MRRRRTEATSSKATINRQERLVNGWYVHQRGVLAAESCEVRWAN